MVRSEIDDVVVILPPETTLTGAQIQAAINAASCAVDQIAEDCAANLNDGCLKQVEIYLAAHFAAVTENTLTIKSEKDGACGGSVTYGFEFGEGVKGTPFGQMANTLSHGCLSELDKAPIAMISIGSL